MPGEHDADQGRGKAQPVLKEFRDASVQTSDKAAMLHLTRCCSSDAGHIFQRNAAGDRVGRTWSNRTAMPAACIGPKPDTPPASAPSGGLPFRLGTACNPGNEAR
jgi:hypothetical protein